MSTQKWFWDWALKYRRVFLLLLKLWGKGSHFWGSAWDLLMNNLSFWGDMELLKICVLDIFLIDSISISFFFWKSSSLKSWIVDYGSFDDFTQCLSYQLWLFCRSLFLCFYCFLYLQVTFNISFFRIGSWSRSRSVGTQMSLYVFPQRFIFLFLNPFELENLITYHDVGAWFILI